MITLNNLPRIKEIIIETITLAEKLNVEYLNPPERDEIVVKNLPSLERYYNDPARIALNDFMDSCSKEELIGLMAVMYLGREGGEFSESGPIDEIEANQLFDRYYQESSNYEKNNAIRQMISKTPLSIYLQKGVSLLNL